MKRLLYIAVVLMSRVLLSQNPELELDDGIYMEKPLPKDTTKHKYTKDNISYKLDKKFTYNYYYLSKAGKKYKFLLSEEPTPGNPLNLIPYDSVPKDLINKLEYTINDLDMFADIPDYTQTVFGISYIRPGGKPKDSLCEEMRKKFPKLTCHEEGTGIVDNRINLWMHPPRSYTFRILQLCPYPFVYLNEAVKNWGWTLTTGGDRYLDKRWIDTKGETPISIDYSHYREKDETIDTPFGKVTCKVTMGTGTCKTQTWIKTALKSYYHPSYGFVRLEYDLINGDKMVIWLEEMK